MQIEKWDIQFDPLQAPPPMLIGPALADPSQAWTMAGQMEQMGAILGQQLMKTAEV